MANEGRTQNSVPSLIALSSANDGTTIPVWVDPTTHELLCQTTATIATQYTEGDTDASITGVAIMWEDAADTLRAVSAAKPLPVDIVDATGVTITADTEFPAAAAITDNFANPTTTSVMAMGMAWDGATWDRMLGDSTDGLLVNLGTNNDITGTVTANAGTNLNTSALALESGGNLDTIAGDTTSIDGKITACNTGAVVVSSGSITANAGTNLNTSALALESGGNLDTIAGDTTSIDGKITACNTGAVTVAANPTATPESGTDATGADTYATVLTPSTTFEHILITNEGGNPATVSIDGGVTATFIRIPGGAVIGFDGVAITATAIQAKNASAGNNYTNLTITVW